ncbi:hypothetical protein [Chromobacterium haemolyticum]|nr:hypothetical protein [Chromobacterium haemolyticum]MDH0342134.1 hypothetical protein [Chromobacterium haemolyticum]
MSTIENQGAVAIDPNETGWQEVKELGLEPEPVGSIADSDANSEAEE